MLGRNKEPVQMFNLAVTGRSALWNWEVRKKLTSMLSDYSLRHDFRGLT